MARIRMLLSVCDTHLSLLDQIANAAEQAGMQVDARMQDLGVISGLIDADKIDALRNIDGVEDVVEDRKFSLPPGTS
jgi:hypothetical protein